MSIEETIARIRDELDLFGEPLEKYEYIIEQGRELQPLDEAYRSDAFLVQGCQSKLWLHPYAKEGRLYFEADSDALIVKGLVQILIRIYSGRTAEEIRQSDTSLLEQLGLSEIITPGRQNGVASMLKRIYAFAGGD
jgi:cysteine desulfuration protein SufE